MQEETIQGAVAMVIVHPSRTMKLKASSDQSTRSWIRRLQRIVQIQKDGETIMIEVAFVLLLAPYFLVLQFCIFIYFFHGTLRFTVGHVLAEAKDEVSNEPKFESKEILSRAESASSATPPVLPPRLPPRDSGERPSEVWPSQARSSEAQPAEAKSSELHYLEDKARMMHPMATMPREALREVQSVNSMPHSMAPGKLENGNKANAGIYSNLPTETAMPSYRGKEDSDDEEPAVQILATSVAPKPEVHVRREGFSSNAPSSSSAGAKPQARQGTDLSAKNSEEDSAAAIPEVAYSKPRRVRMADALIVEERAAPAMSEAKKCEVFDGDSSSEDEDALAAEKSRLKKKQAMAQAKQGAVRLAHMNKRHLL